VRIVLTIHHHLARGTGAPGATMALADAYRAAGHEVELLSFDDLPARMPPRLRELAFPWACALWLARRPGVDVADVSSGDGWVWARLRRLLRRRGLLACRVHGLAHTFWEAEVREAAESEARLTLLSRAYHGNARLREVAADLRGADVCLFLNDDDRDRAVAELGVAPERAEVVPNGIPGALLGLPAPAPSADGRTGIAHIGSYAARKGVRHLAAALAPVLAAHPGAHATFLGTQAPREDVLRDYPAALHDRIAVVERYEREALPALLAGHQVAVTASLAEGLSLALLEAMACGLAPVATDLPGVRAVARDDRDAVLVPPRDPAALERALGALVDDPERLARLRAAAHATAQRYGWDAVAADQLARYAGRLRS
jgi:glycosyltransferase involved in cell wall biosynthesis